MGRALAVSALLAGFALSAAAVRAAPAGAACSTRGLAFSSIRVVGLTAEGVGCPRARGIAGEIAQDVLHGRGISVTGAESLSYSQASCTGCRTTTSVSVTYAGGQVTVALRGGTAGATAPSPPSFPAPPTLPSVPSGQPGPVV
jgi:hypothetical protein